MGQWCIAPFCSLNKENTLTKSLLQQIGSSGKKGFLRPWLYYWPYRSLDTRQVPTEEKVWYGYARGSKIPGPTSSGSCLSFPSLFTTGARTRDLQASATMLSSTPHARGPDSGKLPRSKNFEDKASASINFAILSCLPFVCV